ncbi:hypothetical protein RRG08_032669 [Elysia crispata]|uniref:Uncharacterized protein n=1 Tax=Elysia crispata TaxID=231223 RepID=A0AAE1CQ08_9GAST|nr:hypothetical protein RRG08_032669 [Elysia crispata]
MTGHVSLQDMLEDFCAVKQLEISFESASFERVDIALEEFIVFGQNIPKKRGLEVAVNNARAELRSEQFLENHVSFEIERGFCEDLKDKDADLNLPMGYGKAKIYLKQGPQRLFHNLEFVMHSSIGDGLHVKVSTESNHVVLTYIMKVYLEGNVLINFGSDEYVLRTQNLITILKENRCASVKEFEKDARGFYFIMEGVCKMDIGVKHVHSRSS